MTKVVAIANQKGGVGKTTICVQTALYLSLKLNKRVLLVDFDPQGNASSCLGPRAARSEGNDDFKFTGTRTTDLYNPDLTEIKVTHCSHGVDLIHIGKADRSLYDMEAAPLNHTLYPAQNLKRLGVFNSYDYVLVDCPPTLGRNLVAALSFATHVISPIKLCGFALEGVEELISTVFGVKGKHNPDLKMTGMIVNELKSSPTQDRSLEQLEKHAGNLLFKNKIKSRSPLDTATTRGIPVWNLTYGHVAAKEVLAALEEVIEKVNK